MSGDSFTAKVGKCEAMCPSNELPQHEIDNPTAFEFDPDTGRFDPSLAITKFHRSEADRKFDVSTIRPLPWLLRTISHIKKYVIGRRLNDSPETDELRLYQFLRDRFRAICSEITIQNLKGLDVIGIYQNIALFLAWSALRFADFEMSEYDDAQNTEMLSKTLISLDELYDDFLEANGRNAPLEFDFRAFHLLIYLLDDSVPFMSKLMTLSEDVVRSNQVQTVLSLRKAAILMDGRRFLEILQQMPIQFAAFAVKDFVEICIRQFRAAKKSFKSTAKFKQNLFQGIPLDKFKRFAEAFYMQNVDADTWSFSGQQPDSFKYPQRVIPTCIQEKFNNISILDFIEYAPETKTMAIPPLKPSVVLPSVDVSQQQTNLISSKEEPVIEKSVIVQPSPKKELKQEEPPPASPPELNKPSVIESKVKKPQPKVSKSFCFNMKKQIFAPHYFHFKSMVPKSLPKYCFITLVINDCDDSPSAQFVRSKLAGFNSNSDIIYNDTFTSGESLVYIAIVHSPYQKYLNSIGCVLHCEDTTDFKSGYIPYATFTYDESETSPELILSNCLRKCIKLAVHPFQPYDLTDFVKSTISSILELIMSPDWHNASANAIFYLFNSVFENLAKMLTSELFLKYLLPFIFHAISFEDIKSFSELILKMKFKLIEKKQSKKPQLGSTWPIIIRNSIQINSITPFIVPISVNFDPDSLLNLVLDPFKDSFPTEFIDPPETKIQFNNLLYSFDCDMFE